MAVEPLCAYYHCDVCNNEYVGESIVSNKLKRCEKCGIKNNPYFEVSKTIKRGKILTGTTTNT